jgi:hypothetical protein
MYPGLRVNVPRSACDNGRAAHPKWQRNRHSATLKGVCVRFSGARSVIAGAGFAILAVAMLTPTAANAVSNVSEGSSPSAITSVWAWGNPIDPATDARGLGQQQFQPDALAAFASEHHLTSVYLSVPWAPQEGAFATWLPQAVDALHAAGVTTVSALGGDPEWAKQPQLAAQWTHDALSTADFDAIQFDVEPWASGGGEPDLGVIVPQLSAMFDAASSVADGTPIGADLPWWLAAKSYGSSTAFDSLLGHVDTVAIVAFSDHAAGDDGIVALAQPAAVAAAAHSVPFTIGVETDTPAVAGGPQYTFGDDTAVALETQTALVRQQLSATAGYRGVTAEHLLAWQTLIAH